jgi:hypothetical protein
MFAAQLRVLRRLSCTTCFAIARRRASACVASSLCAFAAALFWVAPAQAIYVGNVPNVIPNTTVNPANYPGWSKGDPGWYNVSVGGGNFVYLGDGWVLSARHAGYNASSGITFQTILPNGALGPVETFYRIPGSYYYDYTIGTGSARQYVVHNPETLQSEIGQTIALGASNGGFATDLQLFRINGDPGLPALTIGSQDLPQQFTRTNAPEVVMIGSGRSRVAEETHWNVTEHSSTNWTWQVTTGPGTHQGYFRDNTGVKRWGTNRLADLRPNFSGDPSDPGAQSYTDLFTAKNQFGNDIIGVVSDTTGVYRLQTPDGVIRSVISMMTVFDKQSSPGATELEFQGMSGNSGSAVFYKRGTQWELVGIVNAISTYPNQSANAAVYGNSSLISDLTYYNQSYPNSLRHIIDSHPNYSHIGDVNLDGVVSGDGTGPPETDDVTAFVLGWGFNNGAGAGTITSWKSGDLNGDGKTDVQDFLLLRGAFNGGISSAVVATLFGSAGVNFDAMAVPEPSAAALALLAALSLLHRRRR